MAACVWALGSTLSACGDGTAPNGVRLVTVTAPATSIRVGDSVRLTATAEDQSGAVVNGTAEWTTSDARIASVTSAGLVTGIAAGEVTITARVSGVSGSLRLTVLPAGALIVSMPGFSFVPFAVTVNRGGSVIFDFPAEPHNVIFASRAGAPADIQVTSNRTVSRTFATAGDFPYDCTLHPGMSGIIHVR
jgi:plastocyanin